MTGLFAGLGVAAFLCAVVFAFVRTVGWYDRRRP